MGTIPALVERSANKGTILVPEVWELCMGDCGRIFRGLSLGLGCLG